MLKSLTLHGFKSFCNRTTLSLSPGITAIVGPNGCGKSNLVDALRWVLGEQNTRILRCDGSVDVIFSGTEHKKAMGMAEVKLLLETPGGEEMEIVRKLTRDGESSYIINGTPCRLRDVIRTTATLGLSCSGYVVIGQGTIHELAGGHVEERRQWIEEAAGIGAFRMEKRETERRLEQVDAELRRLDDLMVELEARRAELEDARRVAARYRELMASRKDLEAGIWLWDLDHANRKLDNLKKRVSDAQRWLEGARARIEELESSAETLERDVSSLREAERIAAEEREEISRALVEMTRQRDEVGGMIEALGREIEARTGRCRALAENGRKLATEKEAVIGKRDEILPRRALALQQLEEMEKVRKVRQERAAALRKKVVDLRQRTVDLMQNLRHVQDTRNQRTSAADRLRSQVLALETEISGAANSLEVARSRRDECRREIEEVSGSLAALRKEFERFGSRVVSLETEIAGASREERLLRAEIFRVSERMRVLTELERVHEGLGRGTRTVLEAAARGMLDGVLGAVGELVSCARPYILALSAAIGGTVENIIVRTEAQARSAIELLRKERAGRVTFLPLDLLRPRDLPEEARRASRQIKGVQPIAEVVSYPPEIEKAVRYLLGRVVLAEDMDTALEFMRRAGWSCRVVTLTGETLEPGGSITGGEAPRHAQVFERKQELVDLARQEEELESRLEKLVPRISDLEERRREAIRQRDSCGERLNAAEAKVTALTEEVSRLVGGISGGEERIRRLTAELEEKKKSHVEAEELLRQSSVEEAGLQEQLDAAWAELRRCEEELREQETGEEGIAARERLNREREALESEILSLNRRVESMEVEAASIARTLSEEQAELCRLIEEKEALEKKHSSLQNSIEELDGRVLVLTDKMASLRSSAEEKERTLRAASDEIERLEKESSSTAMRMRETEAEIAGQVQEIERIALVLKKEYGIEPGAGDHLRRYSRNEALPAVDKVDSELRALGEPNLRAEAEYQALEERISRYVKERDEAAGARDELIRIKELAEREMQRRFRETFEHVKENFRDIFAELFGGGKGDLLLTEDARGVEVIARPPGSRGRPFVMLSGGERSLTGLALIFALIRSRPSPFVVLDEVDTSLDEANVLRFGSFLKQLSANTQFLVITHQKPTIEVADVVYGVTMDEPGISRVLGIRLETA